MKRARRHRRGLAFLAALAVGFNGLAGAFHSQSIAATVIVDDVLGQLTICSQAVTEAASHGQPAKTPDHPGDCPLCLRASALVLPESPEVVPPEFAVPAVLVLSYEQPLLLADHLSRGGIRSRAPPTAA